MSDQDLKAPLSVEALLRDLGTSLHLKVEARKKLPPIKDKDKERERAKDRDKQNDRETLTYDRELESRLLEEFILSHSATYDFQTLHHLYNRVFVGLLQNRLMNKSWIPIASLDDVLRILQAIRLLVREGTFLKSLFDAQGVKVLYEFLESYAKEHFDDEHQIFYNEAIVEIVSIVKRLGADDAMREGVCQLGIHKTLVSLLYSTDAMILQCSLVSLINICLDEKYSVEVGRLDCIEILLRIIQECDESLVVLASDLLDLMTKSEENKVRLKVADGIRIILNILGQKGDARVVESLMNTISNTAVDQDMCKQVRLLGGIPLLLSFLSSSGTNMSSSTCHLSYPATVVISVCTALTQLCLNDDNANSVRMSNGVYLIGQLLLYEHWNAGEDQCNRDAVQLQAFRALRYIFSVERNRKIFKRIFPAEVFELFIDVGHYKKDLKDYNKLVVTFNTLSSKSLQQVQSALDDINLFKGPIQRYVRDYAVQEMIARGGFGSVWQVKKDSSEQLFAMKELSLAESGLTKEDVATDNSVVGKEVNILNKLDHPNIVKYYQSFFENDHLYIIMELVDGASLLDHLNSLKEKGLRMEEGKMWKIFTQICMALKYIHKDKKIVHRDITPSNIMINSQQQVKLADFGLARQRRTDASMMKSVVGTILYSCPEIIQHEFYDEKADIWALGCILYQMATLQPPFQGSNMLTIARRIVEVEYEAIPADVYSPLLYEIVKRLISPASHRPDIIEVISMISEKVIDELNRIALEHSRTIQELELEREARIKQELDLAKAQIYSQIDHGEMPCDSSDSLPVPEAVGTMQPKNRGIWTASPMLTISPRKLRLVNDPISQMLSQLHKIVFVSQLPPSLEPDYNRKCVDRYKRALFSNAKQWNLKVELKKLMSGTKDIIDLDFGIDPSYHAASNVPHHTQIPTQRLSYFELQNMIETVLHKTSYYERAPVQDRGEHSPLQSSPLTKVHSVTPPQSAPIHTKSAGIGAHHSAIPSHMVFHVSALPPVGHLHHPSSLPSSLHQLPTPHVIHTNGNSAPQLSLPARANSIIHNHPHPPLPPVPFNRHGSG